MQNDAFIIKVLSTANTIGKILLTSGAEAYRVEEAITLVCRRFDLKSESFVTMTCVLTSVKKKDGEVITEVNRIYSVSNNLNKIDRIHKILLDIHKYEIDDLEKEYYKKFYLHYNFPPYSVGEVGRMGSPGRRELGHGSLAERALSYVIPSEEEFPYTIRVVSEITESNGSSSQASICGGSLSLMSAGVPIKEHVAGIAMGLIKEGEEFTVLTDIMGLEDHLGDMDFKVAGTKSGITALQMDIKITGITEEIMRIALNQAHEARIQILELMNNTISKPAELKSNVPRIQQITIPKDKIAVLIGPGGKNIKGIIDQTGSTVDITDDGLVSVFAKDAETLEKTLKLVDGFVREVEYGEVYEGRVVSIMKFGAFMEILPGKEGLLHISEISPERVEKVEDVLSVGDVFKVRVISMEGGKISLSKKKV